MGAAALILAAALASTSGRGAEPPRADAGSRAADPAPAPADSAATPEESPPAPLLVPGRGAPSDTSTRTPLQRALDHLRLGYALERQGQPGAALASYNNAVLADPSVPEAWYRAGHLYTTRARWPEAVRCFRAELKYHPEHVRAARELGLALAQQGDTAQAVVELERLTRVRPRDDEAWHALGFAYSTAGRADQAETALRRAIRIAPERAAEHRDLAVLLALHDREDEARREYQRALRIDPRDASIWYNLANLERRMGRHEAALAAYRRADSIDSSFALALQGEARTLVDLGRAREGGDVYRRWLRDRPDDYNARLEAVRLFDDAGRQDIAIEIARDGVRHDPNSSDAHVIHSMALHSRGEVREAVAEMRRAQRLARTAAERARIRQLLGTMEISASDSLRALFDADSVSGDSTRTP